MSGDVDSVQVGGEHSEIFGVDTCFATDFETPDYGCL